MIIVTNDLRVDKNPEPFYGELMNKSIFYIRNGMVIKNRHGTQSRVFEPVVEETDDEYVIRIRKDKEPI